MFVFISQPDFACNPYALWKYIVSNTNQETAWLVRKQKFLEPLRSRGIRCEMYDTIPGNALLACAKYVVANTAFPCLKKSDGQIFINLWHGSGIKAHGYNDPNMSAEEAEKNEYFCGITDLLCVHSLDDRYRLCSMLGFDIRKCVVTGQPRLDCINDCEAFSKLNKVYNGKCSKFQKLILFAPTFRANGSISAGKLRSENLMNLDEGSILPKLHDFLNAHNAALIYKLHPIERNTLSGVNFETYHNIFELTDELLFTNDMRYDQILNAFDVLVSDYSSIVFDFLLLDKPIVYLVPDFDKYTSNRGGVGVVFANIDFYMPGTKATNFSEFLSALEEAFIDPTKYSAARKNVMEHRFDFTDGKSAERVYRAILNFTPLKKKEPTKKLTRKLPSNAECISKYLSDILMIDSTQSYSQEEKEHFLSSTKPITYITEEIPDSYRRVSEYSLTDIADLEFFWTIQKHLNVKVMKLHGGVDYGLFSRVLAHEESHGVHEAKPVIGFAGMIDCRIYFAMVQYICEAFPDYEVAFYGDLCGTGMSWLHSYANLSYCGQVTYEELPGIIKRFDLAILPFYGKYRKCVPSELFQYLACGKCVVTSDMENLPDCRAIFQSMSVVDAVVQVKKALSVKDDSEFVTSALETARQFDWATQAAELFWR